ncbi:PREDICTED: uncharacterized protein LOC101295356 [Fragaria vesca subsp. vesca]|uniref:uncharacterized protein LOC101295356 n=1 Tax=Fragaria vesca subsp. vesca TaxID=101020 RepID=UPI0002C31962|nr:PREDICTED: uncharacterized protein LOC101295356 [Fragaria vesca subsp. vesca]
MQALQHHPLAGDHILRPKSGRTPLKPVNSPATPVNAGPVSKAKPPGQECINISVFGPSNKENGQVYGAQMIETAAMDASLAEELSAMRKKLERIRLDRERTEKMLKEREAMLDLKTKEIENRGQIQKMVEIDVDRVFRLNQLHSQSIRFSPIRSLRQKEQQKKATGSTPVKIVNFEEMEESVGENTPQKLSSASIESEIVTARETVITESA